MILIDMMTMIATNNLTGLEADVDHMTPDNYEEMKNQIYNLYSICMVLPLHFRMEENTRLVAVFYEKINTYHKFFALYF